MKIKILHIFDDLMNLYGEYANVEVLGKYLRDLGYEVQTDTLHLYEEKDISGYDFYYMGAGTERKQKLALSRLAGYREVLQKVCSEHKVMLFTGNSFELLGDRIVDADGREYEGLHIGSFVSTQGKKRITGDALAEYNGNLLVGFINKCSRTTGIENPLFRLTMGFGNDQDRGDEGFRKNSCLGTQMTGPLLVKNPAMLKAVAEMLVGEIAEDVPYEYMKRSYETTVGALKKRLEETKS